LEITSGELFRRESLLSRPLVPIKFCTKNQSGKKAIMVYHRKRTDSPLAAVLLGSILALFVFACSSEEKVSTGKQSRPDSFTFFDVGGATLFSKPLRDQIGERLGSVAIEYRSIIDLDVEGKRLLPQYFPEMAELNARLNSPLGERIEHKTIKLMYRYAGRKNLPFSYVEFMFSNYTKRPLFIKIESKKDIADIIKTLEEKYGQPQMIPPKETADRILYWKNNRDVFVVAVFPNRRGDLEYRMMIYYFNNLEELLATEEQERKALEEKRKSAGRSAF
jgi:hypothetical protein